MLITNILVVDPSEGESSLKRHDIRVANGLIIEVAEAHTSTQTEHDTVFDGSGLWLFPGLIDLHTHLRDFGQAYKEDISTGTQAAAQGGYTTVVAMANTAPPIDSPGMLERMRAKIQERALVEVLPIATVTKNMAGQELTAIASLAEMGAIGFSDDGMPVTNLALLRRALEEAKAASSFIISHPEDKDLSGTGVMHEGMCCALKGLVGIPAASEAACIAREIEVVRATGAHLHFAHVSTKASITLIERAKSDGLPITADTTPHHLTLVVDDIPGFDTNFKMNPPLRDKHDQLALIEGLRNGVIDAIATDHAPHSHAEKSAGFNLAPCGIIGLETAFPLCFERLHKEASAENARDTLKYFIVNPARVLGRPAPSIKPGAQANFTLFDPTTLWHFSSQESSSKSSNSPFNGQTLKGRFVLTLVAGKLAYQYEPAMHRWLTVEGLVLK
jgi:dihydroorotase